MGNRCLECGALFERYVTPRDLRTRPAAGKLCSSKCRSKYSGRFQGSAAAILSRAKELEEAVALAEQLASKYDWVAFNEEAKERYLQIASALRAAAAAKVHS